jgi:3-deoxy-D-manno-octulosonic-acid transferase
MQVIYNFLIFFRYYALVLASFYNKNAFQWLKGRKGLLDRIALEIDHEADYVWFHCESISEFEQGRPVIEKFRQEISSMRVILTFSNPAGYELRKNYSHADHVFYLPISTSHNVARFLEYVKPRLAVLVKDVIGYNFIYTLDQKKIPVVLISAIFRKDQIFFKWFGGWYRNQLKKITYFFVQDKESQTLLYNINICNVVVSGDTRFDRVFEISQNPLRYEKIERFIQGSVLFVAGSTWPADDQLIVSVINQDASDVKYIIVPHEINPSYIEKLKADIKKPMVTFSAYQEDLFKDAKVLILDQVGMLSNIYQYASVAYIGGGFGKGIHNTLEAATFGMPVVFGPNYKNFAEAVDLVKYGGAFSVKDYKELWELCLKLLGNYNYLKETSDIARNYVVMKRGATSTIMIFLNAIINPMSYKTKAIEMLNMN